MGKPRQLLAALLVLGSLLVACGSEEPQPPVTPESILPTPGSPTLESPLETPAPSTGVEFEGSIAFHSDRTGRLQLYLLDGPSGETERLTSLPGGGFEPSWSPGCDAVVFAGEPDPDSFEIYTLRIGDEEPIRLFENQPADDWSPAWSPVGDIIAYQTNQTGKLDVCFVSVDGEHLGCLDGNHSNALPAWSPDGSRILFISNRDGNWEVYVNDYPVEAPPVRLTFDDASDMHPHFSPDGNRIVFDSKRTGNYEIFVMEADGSEQTQLTSAGAHDVMPSWLGNDRIAFASQRTDDWELYVMDADGGNMAPLTQTPGLDKWPVWCVAP